MRGKELLGIYKDKLDLLKSIKKASKDLYIGSTTANYNFGMTTPSGCQQDKIGDIVAINEKRGKQLMKKYKATSEEIKGIRLIFEELSNSSQMLITYKYHLDYTNEEIQSLFGIKNINRAIKNIEIELDSVLKKTTQKIG